MERRELGKTGVKVSAIGVGCWAAGGSSWGGSDDAKTEAAFRRAIELGIDFFDTAPAYGYGHAENLLGRVLKTDRAKIFVATKFGLVWKEEKAESVTIDISPASIRAECDASLKRLGIDRIDLYQCHWPLQGAAMTQTVCDEMMATLRTLKDQGKIRYAGVSNFTPEQIEMCGGAPSVVSVQPPLSILRPGAGLKLIPYCREHGISVLCYSPLFRGLLTGKYKGAETFPEGDTRGAHPDYSGERFRGICAAVQKLAPYAEAHKTTITGVSLNWVLSTPGVTVALAGTRSAEQITQAVAGQGWSLSPEERCQISGLFEPYAKVF